MNNLPVDVLRTLLDGGHVTAVDLDVQGDLDTETSFAPDISGWRALAQFLNPLQRRAGSFPSIVHVLMRAKELSGIRAQRESLAAYRPDVHIRPPVDGIGMFDFRSAQTLIEAGYRATVQALTSSPLPPLAGQRSDARLTRPCSGRLTVAS